MKCSLCKKEAVIEIPYLGKAFCEKHFISSFEKRVLNYIKKKKLIRKGEKIVVGTSGGKDSLSLLYFLNKYFSKTNEIISLTINEGIAGYRDETIKFVKRYCEKWGIKYKIVSFEEEFGMPLDKIAKKLKVIPCTPCGVLRRYLLNKYSKILGDKLATAHNLDDEAQSVLMNILQNDFNKFLRLGSIAGVKTHSKFAPRIKPFREVSEKEVMVYSLLNGIETFRGSCPYAKKAFREVVKVELNSYELKHPGSKLNVVRNFDRIKGKIMKNYKEEKVFKECKICGQPTPFEVCSACKLLEKLNHS